MARRIPHLTRRRSGGRRHRLCLSRSALAFGAAARRQPRSLKRDPSGLLGKLSGAGCKEATTSAASSCTRVKQSKTCQQPSRPSRPPPTAREPTTWLPTKNRKIQKEPAPDPAELSEYPEQPEKTRTTRTAKNSPSLPVPPNPKRTKYASQQSWRCSLALTHPPCPHQTGHPSTVPLNPPTPFQPTRSQQQPRQSPQKQPASNTVAPASNSTRTSKQASKHHNHTRPPSPPPSLLPLPPFQHAPCPFPLFLSPPHCPSDSVSQQ
ncbi:hypothetical protein BZA77DRAFT_137088 [Pyronema omphalodes]|nr:hypothetical protein BZA77DRAFT_137088 [Pyronema omphalodes]